MGFNMIGVQVLSMGGLLSSVFAIPTPAILDPRDQETLLNDISEAPSVFLFDNKLLFDNQTFSKLNEYVATARKIPATDKEFNIKFEKDKFYNSMKKVILKHGDFYAMTREAYISIHGHVNSFHGSFITQMISYSQKLGQYAELASVIYTAVAQILGELLELRRGSPEHLTKLKMLNDLLTGMVGVTMGMAESSTAIHDAMITFQADTIVDSGLINSSSNKLQAANSDVEATFARMKRETDEADRLVAQLEQKISLGDKSEATYWEHYSAVIDSMMKASAFGTCWDTIDSIRTMGQQSSGISQHIDGALQQLTLAINGFTTIAATLSSMKGSFVTTAGDVDPNANPLMFSEKAFKDTMMKAAQDWIIVKHAANVFSESTAAQYQSLGL